MVTTAGQTTKNKQLKRVKDLQAEKAAKDAAGVGETTEKLKSTSQTGNSPTGKTSPARQAREAQLKAAGVPIGANIGTILPTTTAAEIQAKNQFQNRKEVSQILNAGGRQVLNAGDEAAIRAQFAPITEEAAQTEDKQGLLETAGKVGLEGTPLNIGLGQSLAGNLAGNEAISKAAGVATLGAAATGAALVGGSVLGSIGATRAATGVFKSGVKKAVFSGKGLTGLALTGGALGGLFRKLVGDSSKLMEAHMASANQLPELVKSGVISPQQAARQLASIEKDITDIERELHNLSNGRVEAWIGGGKDEVVKAKNNLQELALLREELIQTQIQTFQQTNPF